MNFCKCEINKGDRIKLTFKPLNTFPRDRNNMPRMYVGYCVDMEEFMIAGADYPLMLTVTACKPMHKYIEVCDADGFYCFDCDWAVSEDMVAGIALSKYSPKSIPCSVCKGTTFIAGLADCPDCQ